MSPTGAAAPSAAINLADARPMPDAPPVAMATFPVKRSTTNAE
jgi:hypothetical protein